MDRYYCSGCWEFFSTREEYMAHIECEGHYTEATIRPRPEIVNQIKDWKEEEAINAASD